MSAPTGLTPDTAARLGAILDAAVPALGRMDRLRRRFPDWRIWRTTTAPQVWHARRDEASGRFETSVYSPRRFAVHADSAGALALLLMAQRAADAEERGAR